MFANLRGLREAGRLFALPVYTYVAVLTWLIVDGLIRSFTGSLHRLPVDHTQLNAFTHNGALVTGITLFALMKAFSSGAVALSGVEAISNGVPAFREPKSQERLGHADVDGHLPRRPAARPRRADRAAPPDDLDEGDPPLAARRPGVRPGQPAVHRAHGRRRGDPVPVGQHVVRRLPPAVVDRRPRRLPPPPVRQARRPARLLERDHRGGRQRRRAPLGLRRQPRLAGPALRGGSLHGVHALADRHGPPPSASPRARLAARSGDQRDRCDRDVDRARRDPDLEVHRGRVDPRRSSSR